MRRITITITAAGVALAGGITALVIWLNQPSYNDIVKDCVKALAAQSKAGTHGKPTACRGVKEDDYLALSVSQAINDMPKDQRDLLDYYDDGHLNGSIGGESPTP